MITIQPINAFNDNYIWAIVNTDNRQVIVVDSGQAEPVLEFLTEFVADTDCLADTQWQLSQIWITHKHHDHIGGVATLQDKFPDIKVVAHQQHGVIQTDSVDEGSVVDAWGLSAEVWHIAGHTENHLAYLLKIDDNLHVFCGDTLFSGGCGRVFTGDMHAMSSSLQRLASLADDTLFYPAHEYTASNLKFGLHIEPNNQAMQQRLATVLALTAENKPSLPTSLAEEKQTNVFLRVAEESVIHSLADKIPLDTHQPARVFTGLRNLKDSF